MLLSHLLFTTFLMPFFPLLLLRVCVCVCVRVVCVVCVCVRVVCVSAPQPQLFGDLERVVDALDFACDGTVNTADVSTLQLVDSLTRAQTRVARLEGQLAKQSERLVDSKELAALHQTMG